MKNTQMSRPVRISIVHWRIEGAKPRATILSVDGDLFRMPFGELMKTIHMAIREGKKVIIEPIEKEKMMHLCSVSIETLSGSPIINHGEQGSAPC